MGFAARYTNWMIQLVRVSGFSPFHRSPWLGQEDPFSAQRATIANLRERAKQLPGPIALQILTDLERCDRLIGSRLVGWEGLFENCTATINQKLEQYESVEPHATVPTAPIYGPETPSSIAPSSDGSDATDGANPLVIGGVAAGALVLVGLALA